MSKDRSLTVKIGGDAASLFPPQSDKDEALEEFRRQKREAIAGAVADMERSFARALRGEGRVGG